MKDMKREIGPLLIVAAAVAVAVPALAQLGGVTTSTYDAESTSLDIDVSCRNMRTTSISIVGVCNTTRNGELVTSSFAVPFGGIIACAAREDETGAPEVYLAFTSEGNPPGVTMSNTEVDLSSDGQDYVFRATCSDGTITATPELTLSDGLENVSGSPQ